MANKKLTELPEISNLNFDSTDLLYIVDSAGDGTSSKITYGNLAGTKINSISTTNINYNVGNTSNLLYLSGVIDNNAANIVSLDTGSTTAGTKFELLSTTVRSLSTEVTADVLNLQAEIESTLKSTAFSNLTTNVENLSNNQDFVENSLVFGKRGISSKPSIINQGGIDNNESYFTFDGTFSGEAIYTTNRIDYISGQVTSNDFVDPTFVGDLSCAPLFIDASGPAVGIGKNFNSMSNSLFMLEVSGNIGANLIAGREDYNALFLYSDPEAATNNHYTGGSRITLHANDAYGTGGTSVSNQIYHDARFHNFRSISANGNIMTIDSVLSSVNVKGELTAGTKTFKINHPLNSKKSTNRLVHSVVEAPGADNLYRGTVNLVSGSATVNLDTAAGMTEGTFVELNREIQCFTSNESGYTAVKGTVSGNTLTITSQSSSNTDTISWMVIGERQDGDIYNSSLTDANGKIIVEPPLSAEPGPFNPVLPDFS